MSNAEQAIVRGAVDDGLHEQVLARYRSLVDERVQAQQGGDLIGIALDVRREMLEQLGVKPVNGTATK